MKTSNLIRLPLFVTLFAILIIVSSSCTKDAVGALSLTGSVNLMIVNGAEGSAPQDFYSDTSKVTPSAVAYTQNTGYISTAAGNHQGQFRASGLSTSSLSLTLITGKYYTVYYSGSATSASSFSSEDDMSAPPSGKAKVRFVNLSSAVSSGVDFGITGGAKIISSLAYQTASAYNTVDANSGFTLYVAGSATSTLAIPAAVQAGKIYTIFISGATSATLTYHVIGQN